MLTFLSPEWIAAVDDALRADAEIGRLATGLELTIEQRVTGVDPALAPDGEVRYHVSFSDGRAGASPGPAEAPTIRFSQDEATARAIAAGSGSAQRAFMTGRLTVGGDLRVLLDHGDLLAQVGDVFAAVRARTDLSAAD